MKFIFKLLLVSTLFYGCKTSTPTTSKPNILWITIEDTSPQFIGCYGNENAHTPTIDQLAEEGVRFTNAFSTGTVCSPSRSTLITGVRTFEMGTGNHRSSYPIPSEIHGFPYYMKEVGYYVTNNAKTDYNLRNGKAFIKDAWNESSKKAGWWNRKEDQPFFAVFNFEDSHQSRTMTNPYSWYTEKIYNKLNEEEKIDEDAFNMPPIYKDTPEMRKQFARVYNSISMTDKKIGHLLERLKKDGLKEETIIFFFADHGEGMPRGKTNGIDYGYRVPFVVWFPEKYKHLSPWETNGGVTDELINFEDLAPTLINLAGGKLPQHLKGRILIGEQRSEEKELITLSSDRSDNGIDLVRTVTDGRYIYSRNFMPFIPQQRYIRYMEISEIINQMRIDLKGDQLDSLQKSIFEARPKEYLFDIQNDQWETHNLADDPAYSQIKAKMKEHLKTDLLERRDVMFLPEYEIAKISETGTPYEFRLDKVKYPIDDIFDIAFLSGEQTDKALKTQLQFLNSTDSIERYWAILGLRSQPKNKIFPYKESLLKSIHDQYPPVSIIASVIAYDLYGDSDAKAKLIDYCLSENMQEALLVINLMNYLNVDQKSPFIPTMQKVYELKREYNVKVASLDFLGSLGVIENNYNNKT
ncbi:sulfatase [Flammeovirga sp. EKP202]|uniref:sulfatase family protein n=1 Tax=Flammeovirga sp. EKP202 TaxID=2770592 RepID=UPI00165F56DA|nr:sulfatase [Flammeovirga sp. EKP202]MBD0402022.1 sulfatase [Flammeovirga sp. EKP202]